MFDFDRLRPYLPPTWMPGLAQLNPEQAAAVQEIRLRAGQPVVLSTPTAEWYLGGNGAMDAPSFGVYRCSALQLETCFMRFCEESLYAHERELQQGYVAVPGGIRVGVAGTALYGDGTVRSVGQVTSLCIRLPRAHPGCSASLRALVKENGRLHSTLLVGEPASGKTSLLRDLAVGLAADGWRVTVVDERGELSGVTPMIGCDVLSGYPKATGIRQAVRCLAPQVIVFDELGEDAEVQAVLSCAHAGVAVMASLHGDDPAALEEKPVVRTLLNRRMFENWVFLEGRGQPGVWRRCYRPEVTEDAVCWLAVDGVGRGRSGFVFCPPLSGAGAVPEPVGATVGGAGASHDIYRAAGGGLMEGVGQWRGVW